MKEYARAVLIVMFLKPIGDWEAGHEKFLDHH